jgi:hypothetical protein
MYLILIANKTNKTNISAVMESYPGDVPVSGYFETHHNTFGRNLSSLKSLNAVCTVLNKEHRGDGD